MESPGPIVTSGTPSTGSGQVIDALSGAPLSSITVTLDDGVSAVTNPDGTFQLTAQETGLCPLTAAGSGMVSRDTTLRMPSSGASLSLIPAQFDLATFDEMCRCEGSLHRWTAAPALIVVDAVLQFTSVSDSAFTATSERLTPAERASIVADLTWGLPLVTGGTFGAFASVTFESPAPGASVNFYSRQGAIVVARFSGLTGRTGYWGYGRWARNGDAVVAGTVMLDRDFDRSGSPYDRSLRIHEMGHALGYAHVTRRQSFMNSAAVYEPNDFDRDATKVAFQRPPGNQSPDHDPAGTPFAVRSGTGLVWGEITP